MTLLEHEHSEYLQPHFWVNTRPAITASTTQTLTEPTDTRMGAAVAVRRQARTHLQTSTQEMDPETRTFGGAQEAILQDETTGDDVSGQIKAAI